MLLISKTYGGGERDHIQEYAKKERTKNELTLQCHQCHVTSCHELSFAT